MTVVDIADVAVSGDPREALASLALGSCVALLAWDPTARCGGLLHLMLPTRGAGMDAPRFPAAMFADSGVPLLIERLIACGGKPERLVTAIAGGAQLLGGASVFDVGERNCAATRDALHRANLPPPLEHVGGQMNRSVRFEVGAGRARISMRGASVDFDLRERQIAAAAGGDNA